MKIYKRYCNYCHKYYEGQGRYFCSRSCQGKFHGPLRRKPKPIKICKMCKEPFTGSGKYFCSIICRAKFPVTDKTRKLISLHHADISGSKNPMFKKHHAKAAKLKISKANKGRKATKETREKIGKAHRGKKHSFTWRKNLSKALQGHKISKETKEKIRRKSSRQLFKSKDTSIELKMKKALRKNKIKYRSHIPIARFCIPDIFIKPNLLIQCDGDYWHSPAKNNGKDKRQDRRLKKLGYKILRFKEHKINSNIDNCIKRIKVALKNCGKLL